ncbi:MAG: class I SAM-dependent methyltransferase [Bacillota bacterium]
MGKKKKHRLFNMIAPIYGWFFKHQQKKYTEVVEDIVKSIDISEYHSVLDIGCGTGALASVFFDKGLDVNAVDASPKMIKVAQKKNNDRSIRFLTKDVLNTLPFEDKSFDLVIASYVAHGLVKEDRSKLYHEMSRLAKHFVIIHDYNQQRAPLISFIETLEGGEYFNFVESPVDDMLTCMHDMEQCFNTVDKIDVGARASWYICTPFDDIR